MIDRLALVFDEGEDVPSLPHLSDLITGEAEVGSCLQDLVVEKLHWRQTECSLCIQCGKVSRKRHAVTNKLETAKGPQAGFLEGLGLSNNEKSQLLFCRILHTAAIYSVCLP